MEGPGGIASFAKMTPTQLAAAGFAQGVRRAPWRSRRCMTDLRPSMFGGGRSGAAIMQLMNELAPLATKRPR